MRRFRALLGFGLLLIALAGCNNLWSPRSSYNTAQVSTASERLAAFSEIISDGSWQVIIDSAPNKPYSFTASGPQNLIGDFSARVQQGKLILHALNKMEPADQARIQIRINAPQLHRVSYAGMGTLAVNNLQRNQVFALAASGARQIDISGTQFNLSALQLMNVGKVSIKGIKSTHLDVSLDYAKQVDLEGVMGLHNLWQNGPGVFNAGWVDSSRVIVRSKSRGYMMLAGVADLLDVEISANAKLDAKYLRTKKAFINTGDNASAKVNVSRSLNAFAWGYSNIYYYFRKPALMTQYIRGESTVLFIQKAAPCTHIFCRPIPKEPG